MVTEADDSLATVQNHENKPRLPGVGSIPMLADAVWQMSMGERAALEGVLAQIQPALAIEIGTAEGGSLARVAAHSTEVHSFDLVDPDPAIRELDNVKFHTGDNHVLLPVLLDELAAAGRHVDFVLVDGDHSSEGVAQDMRDLLASPAVANTVILMHDTMNEVVREGLESIEYASWGKVKYVELDFVAGYMFQEPSLRDELWGGLGIVVVDSESDAPYLRQDRYYEAFHLVRAARNLKTASPVADAVDLPPLAERLLAAEETAVTVEGQVEHARLTEELARAIDDVRQIQLSLSWRLTRPLRAAKRLARSRR